MENDVQVVACVIEGEEYALDIKSVQEIIRLLEITRVPNVSPFMAGVINLRGMVIPIMDIRKRFGLPYKRPDETTRIVIIKWNDTFVGILVDNVSEVIRLPKNSIEQSPPGSGELSNEFFGGIGKLGQRLLIMLNIDVIFSIN